MDRATQRAGVSRRELLRRSGLVLLSAGTSSTLLSACGGSDPAPTPGSASSSGAGGVPDATGSLQFLSWEGYDLPDATRKWRRETGIEVKSTYIGNHDEIQAKLLAGGGRTGYDVISYYQGYAPLYGSELGILEPLDEAKMPNLEGLLPFFGGAERNLWINAEGQRVGVPFTWTINALSYDEGEVEAPASYTDVLDPKFKGKVGVVDDAVGSTTLGAHILGFDVGALRPDEYKRVQDEWLRPLLGQSRGVSPSFGDATSKLVSGEAWFVYPGWAALNSFAADSGKDTVRQTIPQEGGMTACDAWALPRGADNADATYSWMNVTLDPKVHAAAAEYLVAAVTVESAVPLLSKQTKALFDYGDLEGLFAQAPLYNLPPVESDEFITYKDMLTGWEQVKAES